MPYFERIKTLSRRRPMWRPALAYCAASYVAGAVLYLALFWPWKFAGGINRVVDGFAASGLAAVFVALVAFIPTVLVVVFLYETRLQRGVTEAVVGGLMGLLLASPFIIAGGAGLSWPFGLAGALAGVTYWLVLGCPRNPKAR